MELSLTLFQPFGALGAILAIAFVAGLVRGFSGFGTAMIFMPVASAVTTPIAALIALEVMDFVSPLPMVRRALQHVQWGLLLPLWAAAALSMPLGIQLLVSLDPETVRWIISGLILVTIAFLASGWRYTAAPRLPLTLGIGGVAGMCGGLAGMAGPPVILFWLSGQANATAVRANLTVFLFMMTVTMIIVFAIQGLFTLQPVLWGVVAILPYGLGIFAGSHAFNYASETVFRRAAFAIIIGSVIIGLPLFDTYLR